MILATSNSFDARRSLSNDLSFAGQHHGQAVLISLQSERFAKAGRVTAAVECNAIDISSGSGPLGHSYGIACRANVDFALRNQLGSVAQVVRAHA